MALNLTKQQVTNLLKRTLDEHFGTTPQRASDEQYYKALSIIAKNILIEKRKKFMAKTHSHGGKQVYYMCMEFLMGRTLKNSLYNLGMQNAVRAALDELGVNLDNIYEQEPDAGLGNGGLGRLAACFMDGLASQDYPATGYSICYEYGIFKQKIEDGWQTELPDNWLPGGSVWLSPRPDQAVTVKFDGEIEEFWDQNYHHVNHVNYNAVTAVPHDMYVSGYDSEGVSLLRLWKTDAELFDMESFNHGNYEKAINPNPTDQAIDKVLYPNDNHIQGKTLRLKQQYFLVCASVADIVSRHINQYGTLDNLQDKIAIHINDTHPALAIPELMRVLLDDCGLTWDQAWSKVTRIFAYTNHTVLSEALETWNEDMFKRVLPRIYQIIKEINERFTRELWQAFPGDFGKISYMSIIAYHQIRMANLCICASHSVNGVSKLHSQILKDDLFKDFYLMSPYKFKNVTNGIAYRRWLYQSNPLLTESLTKLIGPGFIRDGAQLKKLREYEQDTAVLDELGRIKKLNKERFAEYVKKQTGIVLNTDSIFDVQVKRLHEYKRQHLNALHILSLYQYLKQNPNADITPRTFIFGAKAAPGYYLAKQIIKLLCSIAKELENDPVLRDKLRVVYLEDYRVTLSELLMPASEVSEQISLAGTEASGTGNMKLMLNGAVTLGTLDGANVEIHDVVGNDNIFVFGMTTPEVMQRKESYRPMDIYQSNPVVREAVDLLYRGIGGSTFGEIGDSLKNKDPFMVLADFDSYAATQRLVEQTYKDSRKWNRMSLVNIAESGIFSADRSIRDYANTIWHIRPTEG